MSPSPLQQLSALGQSVWVDFLSRQALEDGTIERLIRDDAVVGMTSNPTIFQSAMADGTAHDEQLHTVLEHETDGKEVFLALAKDDVRAACDLLRTTWERTEHLDGQVSLEVDPRLAYDRDGTIAEARRLHELVDRQNLYVKIPATEPGVAAIEETIAAGIPVNVTLIFSLERHRAVIEGVSARRGAADGRRRRSVRCSKRRQLLRLAGRHRNRSPARRPRRSRRPPGPPRDRQRQIGLPAVPRRLLRTALGATGPQRRSPAALPVGVDVGQRPPLPGHDVRRRTDRPQTVNTMPPDTLAAVQDHGHISRTLDRDLHDAHRVFEDLAAAGVDYNDVTATLEREGVKKFADSFDELFERVETKRDELVARHP